MKRYKKSVYWAYWTQYGSATRNRGIKWYFTMKGWIKWWEDHLGPNWFQLRGVHSNEYCMARNGDKGPYAPWNVKCITNAQNCSERRRLNGEEHPMARLTIKQVRAIYLSTEDDKVLAALYGVNKVHIYKIRTGRTWTSITSALGPSNRPMRTGQGARTDLL
jgi:hypothetical protein